ncbi:Hypothetical protein SMAX5B_007501 [Scophthalmus maximus]|uniref:Apolipoprotein M n=1 Tax=Scophthalmus maximus TaxID=52904 RepID=A0A2U9BNP1_SCOMX|nr:uncharacterized protein LOC118313235 [Scophthalmus maximus]AWP05717.1 Hypothetical protein SMAX5B_007501 [Scophthalmus maximus]
MGFVYVAVAALSLLSVGQSAPVTSCESLIQTVEIQGREQLLGKWTYLAESTNIIGSKLLTNMFVESVWGRLTAANESDAIDHYQVQKLFGRCFSLSTKLSLQNSTILMEGTYPSSATLLNTGCTDCLVIHSQYTIGGSAFTGLQLLSRRNKVSAAEREEFMKQVDCLNLPAPAFLDPEKDLCPDESPSQESQTIDLTSIKNDRESEVVNLLHNILNREGGLSTLIKLFSDNVAALKQK